MRPICIRVIADKPRGKNTGREELAKALGYLRGGEILVVPSLDRIARCRTSQNGAAARRIAAPWASAAAMAPL